MLKMLEVIGTSDQSWAAASKAAIEALLARGEKVHFFVLQEGRGTVKGGKVEFQAIVKVAVEG